MCLCVYVVFTVYAHSAISLVQPVYPESQIHAQKRRYYSDLTVSTAAHSYTRLNVLGQILASQIVSVAESGNLWQLLWCDPLKQTQMIRSVKNSTCIGSM